MIWIFTKSYFRTDDKSFLNVFVHQFLNSCISQNKEKFTSQFLLQNNFPISMKTLDLFVFLLPLSSAVTLALKQSMNSYVSLVLLVPLSGFCKLSSSSWKLVLLVFPLFVLAFTFLERRSVCSVWFASSVGVWSWKMNFP